VETGDSHFEPAFFSKPMHETSIFKRSPEVVAAAVGGKSFLLHVDEWVYLELNESGSRIWELLDDGKTIDYVVENLVRDFDLDPVVGVSDTAEFLATLEAKHFVMRG
jgi:hypothetical protein